MAQKQQDDNQPGSDEWDQASPDPVRNMGADGETDDGSPDPQAQKESEELAQAKIDFLQMNLLAKREKWRMWRKATGIEDRWRSDLDVYYGRADPADDGDYMPKWQMERREPIRESSAAQRSTVRINVSAAKTDSAVARVQEILFPTDDKNWALSPEGIDDYEEFAQDTRPVTDANGQHLGTVADAAGIEMAKLRKAAAGRTKEIDEALTKSGYAEAGRDVIEWAGMIGAGVLKGPIVRMKKYAKTSAGTDPQTGRPAIIKAILEKEEPYSESIDPRCFYPDPDCGPDISKASGCFEQRMISAGALRDLALLDNYLPDRIRQVLQAGPSRTAQEPLPGEEQSGIYGTRLGDNFELWEYHGDVDNETLGIIMGQEIDPLDSLKVCVVMVNDIVIGAYQYTTASDLVYDVFNWYRSKETIFGYGIPWKYRTQQRVMNAAWRATMDQMGLAAGVQIAMLDGAVEGADGNNKIRNVKVWKVKDIDDVEKAFKVFEIPSKLQDMLALIDKANDLGDKEINYPDLMNGIKGSAPDEVGSLLALLSNAEGFTRKIVKNFDDQVTLRHISRYNMWFDEYGDDDANKGATLNCTARGADVLFTKSVRSFLLMQLVRMKGDPVFGPHINEREVIVEIVKMGFLDPELILNTVQEVMQHQQQNPPAPPYQVQVQQMRMQADQQADQAEVQRQQVQQQNEDARAQTGHQMRMEELNMQLQVKLADIAAMERKSIRDVRAELAGKVIDANVAKQLQANDAAVKMASQNHTGLQPQAGEVV